MADVSELIAWLSPRSIRYDGISGGVPDLTAIDIAGALGFVKDKFAREIFLAVRWSDGAEITKQHLQEMLEARMHQEMDRRQRRLQRAKLELHIAQENYSSRRHISSHDRRELARCQQEVELADSERWTAHPKSPKNYAMIPAAVIAEVASRNNCPACAGRGAAWQDELITTCEKCKGSGIAPVSGLSRARSIGVNQSNYHRLWHRPYEWTFALVSDACAEAARQLRAALD